MLSPQAHGVETTSLQAMASHRRPYIEDEFLEVNIKYISSSGLKTSEFPRVHHYITSLFIDVQVVFAADTSYNNFTAFLKENVTIVQQTTGQKSSP